MVVLLIETLDCLQMLCDEKTTCHICASNKGIKYKCTACEKYYHALCAYLAGIEISIQENKELKNVHGLPKL